MNDLPSGTSMEISPGLKLTIVDHGDCCRLEFAGDLTDEIETDAVVGLEADHLILDLDGVERITSFGIREWVKLLRELEDVDYYGYVRCRPPIVDQFNMVYAFQGDGKIISLYLPYLCRTCDREIDYLVDLRETYSDLANFDVPDHRCSECGNLAEFDDLPELYLECVAQQGPPVPPSSVTRVLDGEPDPADSSFPDPTPEDSPFRLRKEVVGSVTALWGEGELTSAAHLGRRVQGLEPPIALVCSEIDGIEPEAFHELTSQLDETWYLARVDADLLKGLSDDRAIRRRISPITTVTTVRCPACDWNDHREVELASVIDPDSPDIVRGCPNCYGDLDAELDEEDVALFRTFEPESPPVDVASYLAHHQSPVNQHGGQDVEPVLDRSFGPYTLEKQIGSGGMAEIFLGTRSGPESFQRRVVIKRLRLQQRVSAKALESFKQEAHFTARLSHPNIVRATDFGQTDQFYYMVMELIEGPDLQHILHRTQSLRIQMPVEYTVHLIGRIADALHTAHNSTGEDGEHPPLVHRDVSPHNILISKHGTPKLTDFGIARLADDLQQTSTNAVRGKVNYVSPEMIYPKLGPSDHRIDLFSLGVVLYECLTNHRPFDSDESRQATLKSIVQSPPPRPSDVRPDIPDTLEDIFLKAVAKRPKDRYQSARNFQQDLERVQQDLEVVSAREFGDWVVDIAPNEEH